MRPRRGPPRPEPQYPGYQVKPLKFDNPRDMSFYEAVRSTATNIGRVGRYAWQKFAKHLPLHEESDKYEWEQYHAPKRWQKRQDDRYNQMLRSGRAFSTAAFGRRIPQFDMGYDESHQAIMNYIRDREREQDYALDAHVDEVIDDENAVGVLNGMHDEL